MPWPVSFFSAAWISSSLVSEKSPRRRYAVPGCIMNAARTVVMLISSRATVRSIRLSDPGRRIDTFTLVPFGPRTLSDTCRVVHPFALSSPTLAMTSPRRMPAL